MTESKLLGISKVSTNLKITIVESVANEMGIKTGDSIAFYKENGNIVIKKT